MERVGCFFGFQLQAISWNSKNSTFSFFSKSSRHCFTRTACDSPENEFNLLKRGVRADSFSAENLPSVLMPVGLSMDRAQYLHKEIAPFVRPEFRDILCPSPM